jgi:membrane protease YdiL (CAAX protease family)
MTRLKALITNHAVAAYFILTFAISWGGVLTVVGGPAGLSGPMAQDNPRFPFVVLAMLAGPSVTGLLLTGLVDGRRGLGRFGSRLLEWRVGVRWYAVALLAAPLLATAITLTLSLLSPEFLPTIAVADDKAAVLVLGLVVALTAGFFEELGWTGFAIPRLKMRHGVVVTGLIVGVLWSAWHLLVTIWGVGDRAGTLPLALFLIVDGLAGLPAFRVLMVWVYDRTESLFLGMLMHVSITATTVILTPRTSGLSLLAYGLVFAGAVWAIFAATARARRPPLSRQPLERRVA